MECLCAYIASPTGLVKLAGQFQSPEGRGQLLLGALFGLWRFLRAFTFVNVSTRFENVKTAMVEESHVFRTAILRVNNLPESLQRDFREDVKMYLQARID